MPAPIVVAGCCGTFAWSGPDLLLAYDAPAGAAAGASLVSASGGARQFLSPGFGLPNGSGLVAVPDQPAGFTRILRHSGELAWTLEIGASVAWIAPNGGRIAWLEQQPVRTPSSSVNRIVRLWVANVDGSNARQLLELQAATLHWLADSRSIVVAGRMLESDESGVWLIDSDTGSRTVLRSATFIQAVTTSPDGRRFGYLITFSGDPGQDGYWVEEIGGDDRWRLPVQHGYRWAANGDRVWALELAEGDDSSDRLHEIEVTSGQTLGTVELAGRIRNDRWEISPNGHWVAFWRAGDGAVIVQRLA